MTAQGSAHTRFRRALATGDPLIARAAAAELSVVTLADALELTLVLTRDTPDRFGRAAARWHGRFCVEQRDVAGDEAELALAALRALPGRAGAAAAHALVELCELHARADLVEVLETWLDRRSE